MNVCLLISLFILRFSTGCDMVRPRSTLEVTAYSGESVVLPCSCTEPLAKPHQLKWKYVRNYKEIYPSEHIKRYKNRVTLLNQTTPGNLSLLVSSLTKEDDGDYRCSASSDQYTYIRLHVKGCDMVRPEPTLEVTAYSGESVVLPCSCTEPLAKPHQLQWKYVKNHEEIYPSEHIERYKNRVTLLKQTTPGNLSLLLSSLTKEDDGDYQCSASSDQSIYIRLHVKGCDMVRPRSTLEVTGYSGESVVLPCSCTEPLAKPHQLQWKYVKNHEEIYPSEHIERYKNRVTLLKQTTPGNLSLLVSSLTKEDDGDYQCSASSDQYTFIRLHVKGCDMVRPRSTLDVTAYSGESVVLPCSCTEPLAKHHQLQWKYGGNHEEIYPSEHIERYKNRVTLLKQTTPGNLSLLLSSLTKEDDGDYRCSASSDQYTFIRLHVKEKPHVHKTSTSQPSCSIQQEHTTTQPQEKQTHHTTLYVFCVKTGLSDISTPGDAEEENKTDQR
ncbi:neurotrimin-like isoform X1 [Triplophysa rosa]|uniref:neurotrimin-like isoform X1 n=2 Tax=Triplophysa rosa TaxID=992332 RepID=UPI002545E50C|nr:neurotrimin-like isoform X1 [Triplophysa rosa]